MTTVDSQSNTSTGAAANTDGCGRSTTEHLDRLRREWKQANPEQREGIEAEAAAVRTFADAFPDTEVLHTQ